MKMYQMYERKWMFQVCSPGVGEEQETKRREKAPKERESTESPKREHQLWSDIRSEWLLTLLLI